MLQLANYVISDIHGHYEYYVKMMEKIKFSNADMLYILGDVIDRGSHPSQFGYSKSASLLSSDLPPSSFAAISVGA